MLRLSTSLQENSRLRRGASLRSLQVAGWSLLVGVACGAEAEPEPGITREALLDPATCSGCHPDHYRQWSGSMHAYASIDPVFVAMNQRGQEETDGELGAFCINCHAPMAVREGLTTDGLNLDELPDSMQGVTCYFCHNVASVEGEHNNPIVLENSRTMYGGIADPESRDAHDSAYSALVSGDSPEGARLCGPCHDIVTPAPPSAASVELEQTFTEWQDSLFATSSCSGCHSARTDGAVATGGREDRIFHGHQFAAVDAALTPFPRTGDATQDETIAQDQRTLIGELLDQTLRVDVCRQRVSASASVIDVTLDNVFAGHHFPSGATHDRRAWVEVRAFSSEQDEPVYDSGSVTPGQAVDSLEQPDVWRLHDQALGAGGEPAHMFWDIASLHRRSIPAAITNDRTNPDFFRTHVTRRFPPTGSIPVVPDRIEVLVRMRPVGLDVLDDLIDSGHLAKSVRDEMPTYDLIANRHLAEHPTLSGLSRATFEWSDAVRDSPEFAAWTQAASPFPQECVGLARK